ncbi:MAG TPA: Fic family protein [Patescibacteria group bacterium]|nr:Fic family protein [Patescibacteria group bacterium]
MYTPKFTISYSILKNVATIEACKEVITNAPLIPQWEAKFRHEALVRTVYHGTHIEGNNLTYTEAQAIIEGKKVAGRERDIQEIINYRNVLKYIEEAYKNREKPITEETVKDIHKLTVARILPFEQSGVYRKEQVVVKNSKTGEVSFRPPNAIEVSHLVSDFCAWVNSAEAKELSPVLRSGITHYEITRIHPFLDGNGRTARAIATLVLYKEGYDIRKFFSLEEYFDKNSFGYYQALQSVSHENKDLTHWLEYFSTGLALELTRMKERVQRLSVDLKLKEKWGGQIALSERQIKLLEFVQRNGSITNKDWKDLLPMVSDDTVLRDLKDLMKKKIIKKKGTTKKAAYELRQ